MLTLAGVFALPGLAGLPEPTVLTIEDSVRIGLERSGRVRNAARDRKIADAAIGQVGAQVRPQVSASASYSRLDQTQSFDFGEQSMELGSLDNYAAGVSLRQLVYAGGSVRAALQAARDYRDLESYAFHRVRAGLTKDIRSAFTDLLLLREVVEVQEQALQQLRDMVQQIENRFQREDASEFDLMNARVQLRNAKPDLVAARNDLSLGRASFANLIRLDGQDFEVSGELRLQPLDDEIDALQERARRQRPEIMELELLGDLYQSDIRAETGKYLPSFHLTADYGGENPSATLTGDDGWDWRWRAGIQMSWNWLDGGLRRHSTRRKRLERDKAQEKLEDAKRGIELEVRQAHLQAIHAEEAAAASLENVELAEKSLAIAETRYKTGLATRLEYSDVQLALTRARLNRLRALRDHAQAVNRLAYAVGDYVE